MELATTSSDVVAAGRSDTMGMLETTGIELSGVGELSAIDDVGATLAISAGCTELAITTGVELSGTGVACTMGVVSMGVTAGRGVVVGAICWAGVVSGRGVVSGVVTGLAMIGVVVFVSGSAIEVEVAS